METKLLTGEIIDMVNSSDFAQESGQMYVKHLWSSLYKHINNAHCQRVL